MTTTLRTAFEILVDAGLTWASAVADIDDALLEAGLADETRERLIARNLAGDDYDEGPSCSICDALGHGYPGGPACPLEQADYSSEPWWAQ